MKLFVGALALLTLAGCSTPTMPEMRQTGPAKTYSSNKPEDALAKCILFAWQDTSLAGGGAVAYIQPGRSGGVTVYTQGNEYFADIQQRKAKTTIQYFEVGHSWISKKLISSMETCI
ncbi:hypothetical protein [Pseudomonas sp. NPDC096950]|uniref:hypothetical protein n=1 Tax=Pseudomonas sp. NPDC096950 TaxID=3364485 RepID=UPI00383A8C2B